MKINDIKPFTKQTQETLSQHVFEGRKLSGGCLAYQELATRTTYLKDLDQQHREGTIDLGWKDRIKAVVKCAAVTLLLVAGLALYLISSLAMRIATFPFHAAFTALPIVWKVVLPLLGLGLGSGASVLLAIEWEKASKAFQSPPPEQLEAQLNELTAKTLPEYDLKQLQYAEKQLSSALERSDEQLAQAREQDRINELYQLGRPLQTSFVQDRQKALKSAIEEVHQAQMAVSTI